jgi:hypothetical protein
MQLLWLPEKEMIDSRGEINSRSCTASKPSRMPEIDGMPARD